MNDLHILKSGNPDIIDKKYAKFKCLCGCEWEASENAYLEDWSQHSIPIYCACPTCHRLVYCISDVKPQNTNGYIDYTVRATSGYNTYCDLLKAWNEQFPYNPALDEWEGKS